MEQKKKRGKRGKCGNENAENVRAAPVQNVFAPEKYLNRYVLTVSLSPY